MPTAWALLQFLKNNPCHCFSPSRFDMGQRKCQGHNHENRPVGYEIGLSALQTKRNDFEVPRNDKNKAWDPVAWKTEPPFRINHLSPFWANIANSMCKWLEPLWGRPTAIFVFSGRKFNRTAFQIDLVIGARDVLHTAFQKCVLRHWRVVHRRATFLIHGRRAPSAKNDKPEVEL